MNKLALSLLIVFLLLIVGSHYSSESRAATGPSSWGLTWSDEFDGTSINPNRWTYDIGHGFWIGDTWIPGWGNDEDQYYTNRPDNAYVQDGLLHIRAIQEPYQADGRTYNYTSARLKTEGLFAQTNGRFEFRAKLPVGNGLWPALWMMPRDEAYGTWAASGEIDVLEAKGQDPSTIYGTIHYGGPWPANLYTGKAYTFPDNGSIADFHVYALEWEPTELRWYVDDLLYSTQNTWWSASDAGNLGNQNPYPAPFDQPFYMIMNLAVGGNFVWPYNHPASIPDGVAEMQVDYVRVYGNPVPEPTSMGLIALGALYLAVRRPTRKLGHEHHRHKARGWSAGAAFTAAERRKDVAPGASQGGTRPRVSPAPEGRNRPCYAPPGLSGRRGR